MASVTKGEHLETTIIRTYLYRRLVNNDSQSCITSRSSIWIQMMTRAYCHRFQGFTERVDTVL